METIAATTTRSGLRVDAELDRGTYPAGVKVSDAQMKALPLRPHDFHGEWSDPPAPTMPTMKLQPC